MLVVGLILLISFIFIGFEYTNLELLNGFETLVVKDIEQKNMPDIYYIILDDYAGIQSLKQNFNFDNTEFYDQLSKKGFFVSSNSFSNYPFTILSIPSSLNMQYLDFNSNEIELGLKKFRWLGATILSCCFLRICISKPKKFGVVSINNPLDFSPS